MIAGRWQRLRAPLLTGAGIGLATLALRLRDPHESGSWGFCPFRVATGFDCPGCGGLRAVNDLTHFRILDAAQSNLYFVLSIPVLVGLWLIWLRRSYRGSSERFDPRRARIAGSAALSLLAVFTVVRNTPWGAPLYAG